jgi:hypothetical protein
VQVAPSPELFSRRAQDRAQDRERVGDGFYSILRIILKGRGGEFVQSQSGRRWGMRRLGLLGGAWGERIRYFVNFDVS